MLPPLYLEPFFDTHGGFTCETKGKKSGTASLWRPPQALGKATPNAVLVSYKENSVYQNNNNVTAARYKVKGYRYPVLAWFDNLTLARIA